MIPKIAAMTQNLQVVTTPTNTHKIMIDKDRVSGYTDGLEAMKQAVYLILSTERYAYPIYSWNYGIELRDLFGKQMNYVIPVLKQRIQDALSQDDRITSVEDFDFKTNRNTLTATFTVKTTQGDFETSMEVTV